MLSVAEMAVQFRSFSFINQTLKIRSSQRDQSLFHPFPAAGTAISDRRSFKDDRVQAGRFAKVHLWTVDDEGAITLPTNSGIEVNDEKYVYAVKDDGTVERRYVTVGAAVDDECQILEGISEGEKIIVEGMRVLSNGAKIRDIGEAKKEAPAENQTPVENQAGEGEGGNS